MPYKINILHITESLDIGGLETLLLELLKSLDKDEYNHSVCVLQKDGQLIKEIERAGIPVYIVPKKQGIDYGLSLRLRKLIKNKKIAIVHTHNSTPWLYCGAAIKTLRGIRLIHTKHSNLSFEKKILLMAEHFLSKITDYIVADSKDVSDFMIKRQDISNQKIKLIFNGVDTNNFTALDKQKKDQDKKIIGIVGRLVPVKDHKTLISAFDIVRRKLNNAELWIVGDGPLKEDLVSYSLESGLGENVKFLGARRDIPDLMKQMDLFVLSSLDEGMAITLLEAMASGLPVVATRVGGNPEVVVDGKTGFLVEPKSKEALAEKIIKVLSDDKLAEELGKEARKRAIELFSIEKTAKKYEQLYDMAYQGSKKKICIVGEFPPPYGGMAMQAQYLSNNLAKEDIGIIIINRNPEFSKAFAWLRNIKIARALVGFLFFNINLLKIVLKVESFYIFSNSYLNFYLYTIPPVLLAKIFSRKAIIAYHGGAAKDFLNRKRHFLARFTLKMADYIVVPSDYLSNIFEDIGYKTTVIPNIIDLGRFNFKDRQKLFSRFIVSRHLRPEYNVEVSIRAFRIIADKYNDARLLICGNGPEGERLKGLVAKLGLRESVEFKGQIDNEKMPLLYNDADIFLNSSNIDNQPVAILEAFASGLAVVTTKAGGIVDLVKDKETGLLVELGDYKAMAEAAISLIEDTTLAQKVIVHAKESLSQYLWENIKPRLLPLFAKRDKPGFLIKIYQEVIFRIFDFLRGRSNIQKLKFLRKSQYWSKEELNRWQLDRLNEVLIAAKEGSPFYEERLKDIKLPLASIKGLEDIPILVKSDIRANLEDIKCNGVSKDRFILGKTGGSTGAPMHYYYDKKGRDWNRGSVYRSQEWTGAYLGEKLIQMTGSHYDYTEFKKLKWKVIFYLQRYKILPVSFVNDEVFEQYYKDLMDYKPSCISGYASGIYYFAKHIEENHKDGRFDFLKAIITSSETLYDFQRKKINEIFGDNKVYDHYGSREFYIASECNQHNGYHIHSEVVVVEVVDKDGKSKKPGEIGRILITDLSNKVSPFIRYEIGDVGVLSKERYCPCGVTLPKLERIEGRIADMIVLNDRMLTPPNFTILLSDYEGIEEYQIIQKTKTNLKINIVKNGNFNKDHEGYIKKSLKELTGEDVSTDLEYVDSIKAPESGKRRYIISEVSKEHL